LAGEIEELLKALDVLIQDAWPGMQQRYGVAGKAILLIAACDNPERMRSEASFVAIFGASLLPASQPGIPGVIDSTADAIGRQMRLCTACRGSFA
jgi:hypothetical protein